MLKIVVVKHRGLSQRGEEREAHWPAGWRLPLIGETIHLSRDYGGYIEQLDWDLGEGILWVFLR